MDGDKATKWLEKVTRDQNLENLEDVTLTSWDKAKRFFASRILTPTFDIGYYDTTTKKIVLGQPTNSFSMTNQFITDVDKVKAMTINQDATSQAAKTWTVGAGKIWIIWGISTKNDTRTVLPTVSINLLGGGAKELASTGSLTANYTWNAISGQAWNMSAYPYILQATDAITITQGGFTAGDTVAHTLVYTELTAL